MKAIDHFDISQDVRFSTYAVPMIQGEIRRYLRDSNTMRVSRSLKDIAYRAMQAKERLTGENDCEPTIEQIAKEIGLPKERVVLALEAIVEPVSLYEPVYSDGGDTIYAKIVDFATKTPSNTTGAFYYDARDAVGIALSNITQTGADVDSELQTAQETLEFTMGA